MAKFYWLKLKSDFFKRHDIKIVENMPNGKDYVLFYMKLICESCSHEGRLRFSETIPYDENMLSVITNTNIDIVRSAVKLFTSLGMMERMDDGTIYMNEVDKMIGSAVDNDGANRARRYREKKKALEALENQDSLPLLESQNVTKCNETLQNVTECVTKNNESKSIEIEKEIEIDLEKEIEKDSKGKTETMKRIVDAWNNTCVSFPRVTILSDARKKALNARLNKYTEEDFQRAFDMMESSDFLKGANNRNWQANFDWIIKDANIAKTLDGNYTDRAGASARPSNQPLNKTTQKLNEFNEMMREFVEGD